MICVTILCISMSLTFAQKTYVRSFNINDYSISENNGKLSIESYKKLVSFSADIGKPRLPGYSLRILIPKDSNNIKIDVKYEKKLVYQNVKVKNNPTPTSSNGARLFIHEDTLVSVLEPVDNRGVINYGKFKYLYLRMTPFIYDANNGNLYFVSKITINLPFFHNNPSSYSSLPNSYANIRSKIDNPEDLLGFYPITEYANNTTTPVDYLILTCDSLVNSFQSLKEWKIRKGLHTEIVSVDSIYSIPEYYFTNDHASKIKLFLYDFIDEHQTKWVLLGGDDAIIPVVMHKVISSGAGMLGFTPTDMYYSCFTPFDWPENPNIPPFTDYSIDFNPSVYLSRLPVRSTYDVINYTTKLLRYERDIPKPVATNRILMAGYNIQDSILCSAKYYGDSIYNRFISPYWNGPAYSLYPYDNDINLPDEDDPDEFLFYGDDLASQMNLGYNIIHVVSHGDYCSFTNLLYPSDYESLYSDQPSVIVTNACFTNDFLMEECMSEALIRMEDGGAVSYFGSSREGWGGENGEIDFSFMYNGLFFQNLFTGQPYDAPYSFGAVSAKAKLDMADECGGFGINRSLQLSINPIGDPEMEIFTSFPQSFVTISGNVITSPNIIYNRYTGFLKVVSTTDSCKIVVVDGDGEIHVQENVQTAEFTGLSGLCKITVLKHNYKPFLAQCSFSSGVLPPIILNIRPAGINHIEILIDRSIVKNDDSSFTDDFCIGIWHLSIRNALTGQVMVEEKEQDSKKIIDTTGWPSGVYVVRAECEEGALSEKIVVN